VLRIRAEAGIDPGLGDDVQRRSKL